MALGAAVGPVLEGRAGVQQCVVVDDLDVAWSAAEATSRGGEGCFRPEQRPVESEREEYKEEDAE